VRRGAVQPPEFTGGSGNPSSATSSFLLPALVRKNPSCRRRERCEIACRAIALPGGQTCGTLGIWADYASTICGTKVLTAADLSGCGPDVFAFGVEQSYTVDANNCSGWPQYPNAGANFFPDNYRVWVRCNPRA
jgi:hypothetical protein